MLNSLRNWLVGDDPDSWKAKGKAAIAALLTIGVLSMCVPEPVRAHGSIPDVIVDYYEDSVWAVSTPTGGGSAFHISPTFLVTNKHVADILPFGTGSIYKNTSLLRHQVEVVAVSEVYDLAVLYCATCSDMTPTLLTVEDHWFELGEATYGGGYGLGHLAIHAGYIQSFNYYIHGIMTDTIVKPGDSGSPEIVIEDDGSLRLVGVRSMRRDYFALLQPAGAVAGFIRRIGLGYLI